VNAKHFEDARELLNEALAGVESYMANGPKSAGGVSTESELSFMCGKFCEMR